MPVIEDAWLGDYGAGDAWEGGQRHLRLWRDTAGTLRFAYKFESRSNHGYDLATLGGVVVDVTTEGLTVEITSGESSSWEDLFKEHQTSHVTEARRDVIPIVRIEKGRPVLRYVQELHWFAPRR